MGFNPVDGFGEERRSKLAVRVTDNDDVAILRCEGRICFREEAIRFSKAVHESLEWRKDVILDFSHIESIDSAGLGELVLVYMHARAANCELLLAGPSKFVRDLLTLTNMASLFDCYPTLEAALASLAKEVA
jgi:anti-anti-sigma factor